MAAENKLKSTGDANGYFIVIERLTALALLFVVLPRLLRFWQTGPGSLRIYFIDATWLGEFLARTTLRNQFKGKLKFRLVDMKDEEGVLLRLKLAYFDLQKMQEEVVRNPAFNNIAADSSTNSIFAGYLKKQAVLPYFLGATSPYRSLYLIHVARCKSMEEGAGKAKHVLFLSQRLWLRETKGYAKKYNTEIIAVNIKPFRLKDFIAKFLDAVKMRFLRNIFKLVLKRGLLEAWRQFLKAHRETKITRGKPPRMETANAISPKIAVDFYGQLNLAFPNLHSDLFFWQQSHLKAEDLLVMFSIPSVPLDAAKYQEISEHKMNPVVLDARAAKVSDSPIFYHWPFSKDNRISLKDNTMALSHSAEERWVRQEALSYNSYFRYWFDFFSQNNAKAYVSWYKYDASHFVITDAMRQAGGITAIYQRAFEELPSCETAVTADIVFGFSNSCAEIERLSGSDIGYHVTVGYMGDHRFSLARQEAERVRSQLKSSGAKRILAFFDEGSSDDERWLMGPDAVREDYIFLLEKVLANNDFGLVIKPKKSAAALQKRLGPVFELLEKAKKTGRCFIFEGGDLHNFYPPVAAALASDIAVHGHLWAATAGVESALAGVPTLLLDRDGWTVSKLYKLGRGRVVFNTWNDLWNACEDFWAHGQAATQMGDWSALLEEIDPFRDGRAAERIGTYLEWVLNGFKAGLKRDVVLADAVEQYAKKWGHDKITSFSQKTPNRLKEGIAV